MNYVIGECCDYVKLCTWICSLVMLVHLR